MDVFVIEDARQIPVLEPAKGSRQIEAAVD
jgi:hypothetical protein